MNSQAENLQPSTPPLPIMQSEKAVNYFRVYIKKGAERYGIRYKMSDEELVERFSEQSLPVKMFLQVIRTEEADREFKRRLEELDKRMSSSGS